MSTSDKSKEIWPGVPKGGWKRVLLKLSGEAFAGEGKLGVDPDVVNDIARQIAEVVRGGAEVAVVIGGGNYFRGAQLAERGMDRARAEIEARHLVDLARKAIEPRGSQRRRWQT